MKSKIAKSLVAFLCAGAFCTTVFANATNTKVSLKKLSVESYNASPESIDQNAGWYVAFGQDWVLVVANN
ncbi:hypothetical protein VUJ46_11500 [Chryseobacterium sp. MYb264]|uniref:hypothetical protein n=1 Tax=Chryseobacterium sp. MYb264 TaxID=2745153 RepID=UPI002E130DB6|nr:hypothetical protein VUJ46_11500 [Chryseobacterium sp. MYb264]